MRRGWKTILIGFGLVIAARIVAIPFVQRFAEINNGDSIIQNVIGAGSEVLPWTVGSFLMLCAGGFFMVLGVAQLSTKTQTGKERNT